MNDQASALRAMRAAPVPTPSRGLAAAFLIGSGKGGVGKSVLSVRLAAAFARGGSRVLLFDASQNQGNLHVLLGVRPVAKLERVLRGEVEPERLVVPVGERLWLLPCDSGAEAVYGLTAVDRARLHHRLTALYEGFDAVIVDGGPGIESVVRATMRASRLVVVAVPEPAALSDAYALIKIVNMQVPSLPVDVLVNRTSCALEGEAVHERLDLATRRFLRRSLGFLGAVTEDATVHRAVRSPGGLLRLAQTDPEVEAVAARLSVGAGATE